ncbi:hypothetical protein FACS189472_13590 [Alphaproteobacteria bacterium]|nr:hypothetical protein FACS189472_13590 [Alphaproteobacteria bacterium]
MRAALALVNGSSVTLVQKALRVVTGHGNTDDYSQTSHTSAALSGGLNVGGGSIFGGGISGNTSADARNAKNFNESHQSQNDMSYNEASGIVKSYANSIAHSNANSEAKSSADKYLQSVEQSETLVARKSALEQELHSMTESFSWNRSIGMSTKMSLHDDAREELVQSLGISHEEANRMINKNTPEAQSAFEIVYDQKQHSTQNKKSQCSCHNRISYRQDSTGWRATPEWKAKERDFDKAEHYH